MDIHVHAGPDTIYAADHWSVTHYQRPGLRALDDHGRLLPTVLDVLDVVTNPGDLLGLTD